MRFETQKNINLAFIGTGAVFREGYSKWLGQFIEKYKNLSNLVGICDTDKKKAKKYAEIYHTKYFTNYEEMLNAIDIDAIVINSPPWHHAIQTITAAEKGINILCEKPMATTIEDCKKMVEACRNAGVRLQISLMRRFLPGFQLIRHFVQTGEIGKILDIEVNWPYFIPDIDKTPYKEILDSIEHISGINIPKHYGAWRLKDKRSGGGDFFDHGPHILDWFRFWNGEIDKILALSHTIVEGRNEDFTRAVVHFENGALGFITTTIYDYKSKMAGEVKGHIRGTLGRIDFSLSDPARFIPLRKISIYKEPLDSMGRLLFTLIKRKKEITFPSHNVFEDQLLYFLNTIKGKCKTHKFFGKEDFAAKGEDGLISTRLVYAAYKSSEEGCKWIKSKKD